MKKIKVILIVLIILNASLLLITNYNKSTKANIVENQTKKKENVKGYNGLAIMLQNEKGEYVLSDTDTWPSEGYIFNANLSSCENGGKLSWNDATKSIVLKTSGSDKCYVYFDILKTIPLNDYIISLVDQNVGDGELLKHDGSIIVGYRNDTIIDAQDNSYRYAGNNPNNFICFGQGSEEYNNSGIGKCPLTNQFRIIGLMPAMKEDGQTEMLIKVIKSEYITEKELKGTNGTGDGETLSGYGERIQNKTGIHGFYWSGSKDNSSNSWADSTLKEALNGTY